MGAYYLILGHELVGILSLVANLHVTIFIDFYLADITAYFVLNFW